MKELNLARINNNFTNGKIIVCNDILNILNLPKDTTNISIKVEKNGAYKLTVKTTEEYIRYGLNVYKKISPPYGYYNTSTYIYVPETFYTLQKSTKYYLNGIEIKLPESLQDVITNNISFNVYYL